MTVPRRATDRPFTVALCISCPAEPERAALKQLRRSIRRCRHGVLVTTGCLRGTVSCAARPHGAGAVVVMQPCSVDRAPDGPAHWIGPIKGGDDLRAVCDWLERGEWDVRDLPERLHAELNRAAAVGRRN